MADARVQQWSVANDRHYSVMPAAGASVLSPQQAAAQDQLVSMCFGDEDQFNTTVIAAWAAWAELAHAQIPNVIIHTNQAKQANKNKKLNKENEKGGNEERK